MADATGESGESCRSPRKLLTFLPKAGQKVSRKPSHLGNPGLQGE
jgi:hypothetical protein